MQFINKSAFVPETTGNILNWKTNFNSLLRKLQNYLDILKWQRRIMLIM